MRRPSSGGGTGGGGVVLDGRICPGTARGSCEVGHLIVDHRAGEWCDCGRRGCVQSLASGRAVLRRPAGLLGAEVGFDRLRQAWAAGEWWATQTVHDSADALAAAVGLGELVHPEVVAVGGGFAAGLPGYVDAVARRAAEPARPGRPARPDQAGPTRWHVLPGRCGPARTRHPCLTATPTA
ncbi:ROK family protein [Streptomyces cavernicola]|uniref:ROK family protein n=1 Tax=Streptomyces cavernicola TaxID=3043613 RepID=A0ABT6SCW4_9ACTN|nr:ROK family protein [Streptomyces sp. B-S-A6]MDI3405810.1 ROK family protein [Streptomyces sp. B-S-A6]